MPKSANQQQKLLRLQQIFLEETDETHGLTIADLIDRLEGFGIRAERKSLYENMDTLNACGMDILKERRGGKTVYYVADRTFEEAEVRLLADAVASSRFITVKKSEELLKKLTTLTSRHHGAELRRQLYVASRIKNMNETIYYVLDELNRAMHRNVSIQFCYYDWRLEKDQLKKTPRHNGRLYTLSPWQLLWQDELYYLIAYDHLSGQIRHYRVDRMGLITLTEEKRRGKEAFAKIRMEDYTSRLFGMFGGESRRVALTFPERLLDVMVDRFGKELHPSPAKEGFLKIRTEVIPSLPFYGWLFSLGPEVRLTEPEDLKETYKKYLQQQVDSY
ncbi:MAG: WYL domain-containing protein [Clostridia bacterium]|nr:WYL domain-containing protein [Clostridia bacterium]